MFENFDIATVKLARNVVHKKKKKINNLMFKLKLL